MSQRFQQSSSILSTELSDNETVMLDPDAATYFGLRETGPLVWNEFATPATVDEVVERIEGRFEAPAGAIRSDVEAFVSTLRERALLVEVD